MALLNMSIIIRDLTKSYHNVLVLNNINFIFEDKKHYLIKGENGIGKSTLFKTILGQAQYEGYISVTGRISYEAEDVLFPSYMEVESFITTFSTLTENIINIHQKIGELLTLFGMDGYQNKQLGSLSKGQKEKVNLIQALLTPSEILIMDEPFSGLDPESKKILMKIIRAEERMVIIVSHETTQFRKKDFVFLILKKGSIAQID